MERHVDAERRTVVELSFRTLQRGNAVLDALRRKRTQSVRKGMRCGAPHDKFWSDREQATRYGRICARLDG
ncbi:DUF1534 domain-containing protein [Pseudomonas amygdali pv. lachrymans str. M301315]|uniref:DUF1534 domain-containing protein n=1 Tax=Pseudomonas amygdali pv. lachrymans str. M301315 TaxID=629260 RepID=A0AAD0M412_PSEAV|nr:DUF1534 domain-containing protein [Pseudomonas amygdali pv. lachrymans str. M301315]PWD03376.1 hypothetical protein CX658_10200 [Pseudomonas amygdali pv. lachrymans]